MGIARFRWARGRDLALGGDGKCPSDPVALPLMDGGGYAQDWTVRASGTVQLQAEHVPVEGHGTLQMGHSKMDVAYGRPLARRDCRYVFLRHFFPLA